MSRTYKATGINLKGMPLGESDRLLTILTRERGLIRIVAPGARKPRSKVGGRSGLFVVNELLLAQGRSLDKLLQAETLASFPGLSRDLSRLTASQYLAEVALGQALSDQPQEDLFDLLVGQLGQLEQAIGTTVLATLVQATLQLLTLAGLAPQLQNCCLTQHPLTSDQRHPDWRVGFSLAAGGIINPLSSETLRASNAITTLEGFPPGPGIGVAEVSDLRYESAAPAGSVDSLGPVIWLTATELDLLQQLDPTQFLPENQSPLESISTLATTYSASVWLVVEQVLRQHIQYHFNRPIRAAALVETCFCSLPRAS